jgi:hypothetical protein
MIPEGYGEFYRACPCMFLHERVENIGKYWHTIDTASSRPVPSQGEAA